MKPAKKESLPSKKYPPGSFMGKLRKQKIIETLSAFIGGGFLFYEIVHWILVDHYHLPEKLKDVTIVTILCALLCTLTWRWFGGTEKRRKVKLEFILIPIFILASVFLDVRFVLQMGKHEEELVSEVKWKNSIAVLPFANISPEEGQEYFCDGLTEELINALSNVKELKVAARTSAFSFKNKVLDIRQIGEKLSVGNVLEGSVRKAGDKLRITAQLVNVESGFHLWSEKYDRKLEDVFAIQDEITLAIINKLKLELLGKGKGKLLRRHTDNLEAYNLYLQGRYFWNKRDRGNLYKSIEYFKKALEKDLNYVLAYTGLADSYIVLGNNAIIPPEEAYPKAREFALKALEINNRLAEAHAALALIKQDYDWDWAGSEEEYKIALQLNPGYGFAHMGYAFLLSNLGQHEEAIEEVKTARDFDPLSPRITANVGYFLYRAHKNDQALEELKKAIKLYPEHAQNYIYLAVIYAALGRYEEALTSCQQLEEITGEESIIYSAYVYSKWGKKKEAEKLLTKIIKKSEKTYISPTFIAWIYGALGDYDRAFSLFEKAYSERDNILQYLKVDPRFDPLRSDQRFRALLKKMKLE